MTGMDQRSAEWFAARLGRVTASRVADVLAVTKSGPSASRANYAAELVVERLTGNPTETFSNAAMQRGTDLEPAARDCYVFASGNAVTEIGFVVHPAISMSGASPDGLVGTDGLIEIKCPGTAKHIDTLLQAKIDDRYIKQMQWQMACTGRAWCDFVSYDPRLPEELQLAIHRIERDADLIATMEASVSAFLTDIQTTVGRLNDLRATNDNAPALTPLCAG